MKTSLLALFSLLACPILQAQTYKDLTFVTYGTGALKLNIYLPSGTGPFPYVLNLFGGGYANGNRTSVTASQTNLVNHGIALVSCDYRLSGTAKWPAQEHDAKAALRWLRTNASTYQLDPNHVGLWGQSSGAGISSMVGTGAQVDSLTVNTVTQDTKGMTGPNLDAAETVQAVALWFPPTDFLQMQLYMDTHDATNSPESKVIGSLGIQAEPEKTTFANPMAHIRAQGGFPPFLIMHGTQDLTNVPFNQSELLHAGLLRAGANSTFCPQYGLGHGGTGWDTAPTSEVYAFFRRILKGETANLPTPAYTLSATSGAAPLSVTCNGSGSQAASGSLSAYQWSFGDNTGASGAGTTHIFSRPGNYPVTLCVVDSNYHTRSLTQWVTVTQPVTGTGSAPTVSLTKPSNSLVLMSPATVLMSATATATTGTIADVAFYIDGEWRGHDFPSSFTASGLPYTLGVGGLTAGTHTLTAVATDSRGVGTTSAPVTIEVLDDKPTFGWVEDAGSVYATLAYDHIPAATNRSHKIYGSGDLASWTELNTVVTHTAKTGGVVEHVVIRDTEARDSAKKRFLRMGTATVVPST